MQNFIKLQNIINDPKKSFDDFASQLINSDITQSTYICLLLNIAATIKRPNFNFKPYLDLLTSFKNQPNHKVSCVNYTGYKDKISILMNACEKSVSSTVAILATHPDIKLHIIDPNGMNAIFYAIKNPDENEGLKILEIFNDLSPQMFNSVINNGYSPLFLAVQKYRIRLIDFLLKNHIDPNQKLVSSGNTALHQFIRLQGKYSIQQIRKLFQVFMKYDFDFSIENNLGKTVEEYALEYKLDISQIIKQLKQLKSYKISSQMGYQQSDTQAYSSKKGTNTKVEDIYTNYNYSQLQGSQFYHEIDTFSVSNKSLLSQQIHFISGNDQRQFSLDMNLNQSQKDYNQIDTSSVYQFQKKMECHSHSDSPNSDFQLSQKQEQQIQKDIVDAQVYSQSSQDPDQGQNIRTQQIDYIKVQKQIIQFNQISQVVYRSAWQQIQPFFQKLHNVTQTLDLSIQIIGSFATGLWTHHSDIDIALVSQRLLEKVYNKLKTRMYNMGIKQLCYNKACKIPSIKIQMDPYLFSSRKIDIMVFHKKNMGISYVNYIRQALSIYCQIRPIFFFLKRVCEQFGLHDPFNGGMKSYSIFLMIYSLIRTLQLGNLAQILLKISLYYGFYHEYQYEIEYRNSKDFGVEYVGVPRLNIKDPLNTKNNMGGKNTDVYKLKNMFRTIYYGLHYKINKETTLQHILQIAKIIL